MQRCKNEFLEALKWSWIICHNYFKDEKELRNLSQKCQTAWINTCNAFKKWKPLKFFSSMKATIKPIQKLKTAGKNIIKEICKCTIGLKHIQVNVYYIFLSN